MQVSIITPTFQSEQFIAEMLDSVHRQPLHGLDVQHIVVDSASSDDTQRIVRSFPNIELITERDTGAGEALNKGLEVATGDFVLLLMSDDRLRPGAWAAFCKAMNKYPKAEILRGSFNYFQIDSTGQEDDLGRMDVPTYNHIELNQVLYGVPMLNALFCRRSVYRKLGGFRSEWPLSNDREFMARCAISKVTVAPLEHVLCDFRIHPLSATTRPDYSNVTFYLREHIFWSKKLLTNTQLREQDRKTISDWRGHETLRLALYFFLKYEFWRSLSIIIKATIENPFWVKIVTYVVWKRLAGSGYSTLQRRKKTSK